MENLYNVLVSCSESVNILKLKITTNIFKVMKTLKYIDCSRIDNLINYLQILTAEISHIHCFGELQTLQAYGIFLKAVTAYFCRHSVKICILNNFAARN